MRPNVQGPILPPQQSTSNASFVNGFRATSNGFHNNPNQPQPIHHPSWVKPTSRENKKDEQQDRKNNKSDQLSRK
jgi:hypothetical protein